MSKFITHILYKGAAHIPTLQFSDGEEYAPLGTTISLSFALTERYCTGWHDIATGENHPCPDAAKTDRKFETCVHCQKKTGFNPAFYNTTKISPQQEARNAEPHRLYLAHMGGNYIKVGISWDKRGINRLLDQGARAGLVLETFPTALIARQYEAKIARFDGIHETTSTRTKLSLLEHPFDNTSAEEQLLAVKQRAEETLAVNFSGQEVLFFDSFYTGSTLAPGDITPLTQPAISGRVEALIADILITNYDGRKLALPLKQYIGYPAEVTDTLIPLDLDPQQMQLF
jgi:hypothetical protein